MLTGEDNAPRCFEQEGWSLARLRSQRNRAHFLLEDPLRYVTVILFESANQPPRLFCLDSPCYHAAGPLGEGELEEIESIPCIRCPWHQYIVSLDRGEEVRVPVKPPTFDEDSVFRTPSQCPGQQACTEEERERQRAERQSQYCGPPQRGRQVQRTHRVTLDEASEILTIEIEAAQQLKRHPMRSDASAESMKYGGMSMQVFDIKSRGLS